MTPNLLSSWNRYQEGMKMDWPFLFNEYDVKTFSTLSKDRNPIHMNESFAKEKGFDGTIIHGLLLATQISRLVGEMLPDQHAILTGFNIDFVKPAYINDSLTFKSILIMKSESTKLLKFNCQIRRGSDTLCQAKVFAIWRP